MLSDNDSDRSMSIVNVIYSIVTQKNMKLKKKVSPHSHIEIMISLLFCKSVLSHTLWKKSIHAIKNKKKIIITLKKIRVKLLKFL